MYIYYVLTSIPDKKKINSRVPTIMILSKVRSLVLTLIVENNQIQMYFLALICLHDTSISYPLTYADSFNFNIPFLHNEINLENQVSFDAEVMWQNYLTEYNGVATNQVKLQSEGPSEESNLGEGK